MMSAKSIAALALLCSSHAAVGDSKPCPPVGYSQSTLTALKERGFTIKDDDERNAFALSLVPCLASGNPVLRDGIAFESLSTYLRGKQLRAATAIALMEQLVPWLDSAHPDPQGIARPFAALVLSEVARMDRIDPFMNATQRSALLNAGVHYLTGVRDYRGFDSEVGWRHGVAHGADLVLQLVLNPQVDQASLKQVLDAVAVQVVPQSPSQAPHFYIFGESDRLVRPVFYAAQRHLLPVGFWREWMQRVASPEPFTQWGEMFNSQIGLAKRHNTRAFLIALYLAVQETSDLQVKAMLLPLVRDALDKVG